MIEEQATVVAREGDYVWLEAQRASVCGACSVSKGCGTSALASLFGRRAARTRALDPLGVKVGEQVVIGLQEGALVQGSVAVYLVPLLAMLGFALLGEALAGQWHAGSGEGLSAVFGIFGLFVGGVWLRGFTRRIARDRRYQPVVLRRAPRAATVLNYAPTRVSQ